MATKTWRRCWLLAGVLALIFGLLLLPFAKRPIDNSLQDQARNALDDNGMNGVKATSKWAKITLTGPASAEQAALQATAELAGKSEVNTIRYVATDAGTVTATDLPTPSSSMTDKGMTKPVSVEAAFDASKTPKVVLTGEVASKAQRTALVSAAQKAVGADQVTDKLTVGDFTSADGVDAAAASFGALVGSLGSTLSTGKATLADTEITVSGTGKNAADAAAATAAITASRKAGAKIVGSVTGPTPMASISPSPSATAAPTAPATPSISAQLAAVPGIKAIRFNSNSAVITPAARVILDRVAVVLAKAPQTKVKISGFTDNRGSSDGIALSQARANSVKAYLVAKKIPASSLTAAGYGEANPIASNNTIAGQNANRRIEFTVQGS